MSTVDPVASGEHTPDEIPSESKALDIAISTSTNSSCHVDTGVEGNGLGDSGVESNGTLDENDHDPKQITSQLNSSSSPFYPHNYHRQQYPLPSYPSYPGASPNSGPMMYPAMPPHRPMTLSLPTTTPGGPSMDQGYPYPVMDNGPGGPPFISYPGHMPPMSYTNGGPVMPPQKHGNTVVSTPAEHYVMVHVNQGETVLLGGQPQQIQGPASVRMICNNGPPLPMSMQVPPGHQVHQIVDEHGVLNHVILSAAPVYHHTPPPPTCITSPSGQPGYSNSPNGGPMMNYPPNPYAFYSPGPPPPSLSNGNQYPPPRNNPNPYHQVPSNLNQYPGALSNGSQYSPGLPNVNQYPPNLSNGGPYPPQLNNGQFPNGNHCNQYQPNLSNGVQYSPNVSNGQYSPYQQSINPQQQQCSGITSPEEVDPRFERVKSRNPQKLHSTPGPSRRRKANRLLVTQGLDDSLQGLSSSGDESNWKEHERRSIEEMLKSMPQPQIAEIEPRSARVHLFTPQIPKSSDSSTPFPVSLETDQIHYKLFLSFTGIQGKYPCVFSGESEEILLQDLTPNSDYHVKACAIYSDITGECTTPLHFSTPASIPDAPKPPTIQTRSWNTLALKWIPPQDNGDKITSYLLQYLCPKSEEFQDVYSGSQKYFKLTKLQPSTVYCFRLSAHNSIGKSPWSDEVSFTTLGSLPPPPAPPSLSHRSASTLHLSWKPSQASVYVLQMEDPSSGFGFLAAYHGPQLSYEVRGLYRNSPYRFRLAVSADEGQSRWSDIVTFVTQSQLPPAPRKLQARKLHPTHLTLIWEAPSDDGGSHISSYQVELSQGASHWQTVYTGQERECTVTHQVPGSTLSLRVRACVDARERGEPSDPLTVVLPGVVPEACSSPRLVAAQSTALHISWTPPSVLGVGHPVKQYQVIEADSSIPPQAPDPSPNEPSLSRVVYSGPQLDCWVSGLTPAQSHRFSIRASNSIGSGPWSPWTAFVTAPGPPEVPSPPSLLPKCPFSILASWTHPNVDNVTQFRLERALDADLNNFVTVYTGDQLSHQVRSLCPASPYSFRLTALNSAGPSPPSDLATASTLPAPPPQMHPPIVSDITSRDCSVSWQLENQEGCSITSYTVEVSPDSRSSSLPFTCTVPGEQNQCKIPQLTPATNYKCRIQASSSAGSSPFSLSTKFSTLSLPPNPPRSLECLQAQHSSLKIKWSEPIHTIHKSLSRKQDFLYQLEMKSPNDSDWQIVYVGPLTSHKVTKLQELTSYEFRIVVSNEAGAGLPSSSHTFSTTPALPPPVKGVVVTDVEGSSCRVEWSPVRSQNGEEMIYTVELAPVRLNEKPVYSQVYQDTAPRTLLTSLSPGHDYQLRVSPRRQCASSLTLKGPFSPPLAFSTPTASCPTQSRTGSQSCPSKPSIPSLIGPKSSWRRLRKSISDRHIISLGIVGIFFMSLFVAHFFLPNIS